MSKLTKIVKKAKDTAGIALVVGFVATPVVLAVNECHSWMNEEWPCSELKQDTDVYTETHTTYDRSGNVNSTYTDVYTCKDGRVVHYEIMDGDSEGDVM